MEIRKTASDYRKEYKDIKEKEKSLDAHITKRLLDLSKSQPEGVIARLEGVDIKINSLTQGYLESLTIERRLRLLDSIESWINRNGKIQQTEFPYIK